MQLHIGRDHIHSPGKRERSEKDIICFTLFRSIFYSNSEIKEPLKYLCDSRLRNPVGTYM